MLTNSDYVSNKQNDNRQFEKLNMLKLENST